MNDDHATRIAEIEAVLEDYAEVFEPPKYHAWPAPGLVDLSPGAVNVDYANGTVWYSPDGMRWVKVAPEPVT